MSQRVIQIKWSPLVKYTDIKNDKIPTEPGVYEYFVGLKEENKIRYEYVGVADNLRVRHIQHVDGKGENVCLNNALKQYVWYYKYAIINNLNDRLDAELGLYSTNKHTCNVSVPPGSGKGNFKIIES